MTGYRRKSGKAVLRVRKDDRLQKEKWKGCTEGTKR